MDSSTLIKMIMIEAVPFAKYMGIEILQAEEGHAKCGLALRDELKNHLGSMHAGAIYSMAETASGAAMASIFKDQLMTLKPVAASAEVRYLKLAKGNLTATAKATESADGLREKLAQDKKVRFGVQVSIEDERGVETAQMDFDWVVR